MAHFGTPDLTARPEVAQHSRRPPSDSVVAQMDSAFAEFTLLLGQCECGFALADRLASFHDKVFSLIESEEGQRAHESLTLNGEIEKVSLLLEQKLAEEQSFEQ